MTRSKVNALLTASIIVLTVCPLLAALYFVDKVLATSLNLGFNSQVIGSLESSAQNLKTLARLDPERQDAYREQFDTVQELQAVYASPDLVKDSLRNSLLIYFAIGVFAVIAMSVIAASLLGRRIALSYRAAHEELTRRHERMRYLEEMSSWQELAKTLAHEIKNPLTPIEVLVTSLGKAHAQQTTPQFAEHLAKTQAMMLEELAHLNATVQRFSGFAKLPSVQLETVDIAAVLPAMIDAVALSLPTAMLRLTSIDSTNAARVGLDSTLFRQVLSNILRNGVEANPDRNVTFTVELTARDRDVQLSIANDGAAVPHTLAPRIFDPYISGKSGKDNLGLGLAIARKIVLEHGGDIAYEERHAQPVFVITLPRTLEA